MFLEVFFSLFLVWFIWYMVTRHQMRREMPPGPLPLPFVGNLHQLGYDPLISYKNLNEKYGDIFTVWFHTGPAVVLNSAEVVQEALVTRKDDIAGRSPASMFPLHLILGNIFTSDYGPSLLFRRKVFKTALHVYGAGIGQAEERAGHAVQLLLDEIEKRESRPFYPKKIVYSAMICELWRWLTRKKLPLDHETVTSLIEFTEKFISIFAPGSVYYIFPFLWYLPTSFQKNFNRVMELREDTFVRKFQEHRETYQSGVIRDLTDSFLSAYEIELAKESRKEIGSYDDVKGLMFDVLAGGGDTSSSFVCWFVLCMVLNQEVQERIQAELDTVVGRDRLPCWQDAENLHYLQASICEVLRLNPVLSFTIHNALRDTTVKGYKIPKDVTVVFNFLNIHQDSNKWTDPKAFRPDRFLDSDEKFVGWTKFSYFIPFNIGRRACPGAQMGKIQTFLFASALLHRFKFQLPQGKTAPSLEYEGYGDIIFPKYYEVVAKKRL